MAKLGDFIEQIRGVSYRPSDLHDNLSNDSVILLRANNIQNGKIVLDDVVYVSKSKVSESQYLRQGDILVCTSSGSKELVGKAAFVDEDLTMVFGAFCKVVRPKIECCKYMGHFFQSPYYRNHISAASAGANINNLRNEHIADLHIPLPSLDEQRKIAAALDKVSGLIAKRRQQLDKLDELVKARFVEMFGDPLSPSTKWEKSTMGKEFSVSSGGTPATSEPSYWEAGTIPWIGSNLCQNKIIYQNDGKFITQKGYENSSAKWCSSGTVLIALVGATIGKTALLRFNTTTNQNIAAINVNGSNRFVPEFVFYHLQFQYESFMQIGDGKFKMANLNFIRQLQLLLPPLQLQQQFSSFAEQTEKSKTTISRSLEKLEMLKKAMMQEYFG